MEWNDLSNSAKSIIEWIENPITNRRETIEIKIGEVFHRKCPMYCGDNEKYPDVDIVVTKELYQEILKFVTEDNEIQREQFMNGLLFKLKEDSNVKLH